MIKKIGVVLLLSTLLVGCGGSKRAAKRKVSVRSSRAVEMPRSDRNTAPAETSRETEKAYEYAPFNKVEDYIEHFAPIAKEEMRLYKIPASITMAQAVLESGAGNGNLTKKANNHFGIKCHNWTGAVVYHDDDEKGECFRKYRDPKYSFRDHSLFLTGRSRYADLFDLDPDDYKGWAKGLRKAGYATDRKYPEKLIAIIERYAMYNYDAEVLGNKVKEYKPEPNDKVVLHTVKKGETLYSISRRYNLTVDELKKNNGLRDNTISIGQQLNVIPQYNGF
ncbi:flagellum-specific peptidoglycan hydrolase FlgJ [Leeuwenhoekiella aestuarii]|uniref:Peptidoglycan hydrolase n=1 Tax=Leeuwenhoekiella aestuarii TaxID=2249426 RepID=A0A4Q0NQ34_9FLAO|nr:glucosaminidase domain-containing protein [Leeuwenhoekiella aestuarii]RXG11338.1 flagellum-specific peptidoglycan hydrolase FlgJ [Leeuwenhoekiella aestuarii]RXG11761.1 flagellum-specific peptidoglycan hydrolase FlgJ [Leeuwenhoekiella aestuarii]